ncbi:MAG: GNAT family N-acetyltransferase [Acidimicrobiales bacterium]|nr:GNAT family N-acetyltransferase [Acidimicrobiales bacterium]
MEAARLATEADLDVLVALWERSVAELDGQRGGALLAGGLVRGDLRRFLNEALVDPDRAVVLGLIDDVAVGLASAVAERRRREPLAVLEVVYVDSGARQIGVAGAMVDVISAWCRSLGLVGIDAPALPGNRPAKAFFESHGFLARLLVMHHPVEIDGDGDS